MKRLLLSSLFALPLFALPLLAAEKEPPGKEASISFVDKGGIQNWSADGEKGLYIEGRNRQWYYASLMSPCIGLNFAEHIGFVSEPNNTLDKFSSILVDHKECHIKSLVTSDGPPKKSK
eukprot:TRINITY_DN74020_c0_g1_i1.p1 TRINITY_DN74020_c0_g1~~TRINITY_DN74020_c0_g1_i1.p1  ORF type:complete len:119 (+),score=22.63 TRINITY_DN74020_c0_g1_i1:2-358(+)